MISHTKPAPSACVYALRLLAADPQDPTRIAGRLEHVLSGRVVDFADGPALLACLAQEQRRPGDVVEPGSPS